MSSVSREGHLKVNHWFQIVERLDHDLLPNANRLSMPTLIVVGSEDKSCPLKHQERFLDAIPAGSDKEIFVIPGAPHSFYKQNEQTLCIQAIKDWLEKRIL